MSSTMRIDTEIYAELSKTKTFLKTITGRSYSFADIVRHRLGIDEIPELKKEVQKNVTNN